MKVNLLGVPSSAGAYCVGVERAPAALRDAGLAEALTAAGNDVRDAGDLTTRLWAPDREHPYAQNLGAVAASTRELAEAAAVLLAEGERLLVLGGSCAVAVGVCAAMASRGERPRLVYVDRHLDLNTPQTTDEGSLSWMGIAHALAVEGAEAELADATGGAPLLHPADLVYLGADVEQSTEGERAHLQARGITVISQAALTGDPLRAAQTALAALPAGAFFVHLDVDVLDFLDAPLAENVNGGNSGPTIAQLGDALVELWQHPDCRGLSIGQLDPAHAASDPSAIPRLIDAIARAARSPERTDDVEP